MFNNLSIKKKLYAGFGAILAILLVLLASAYDNFIRLSEANKLDRHTMQVILEADRIENVALEIQAVGRAYFLNGIEAGVARMPELERSLQSHVDKAVALTSDNPLQNSRFRQLDAMTRDWITNHVRKLVEYRRSLAGTPNPADQMGRSTMLKEAFQAIAGMNKVIEAASAEETRLATIRAKNTEQLRDTMLLVLAGGGALCVVLAAGIAYLLVNALTAPLNNLTQTVGRIASGDQSARVQVTSGDELGQVGYAFNDMAQAIQDNMHREISAANELRTKVDALLDTVSKAASGDLTGKVTVTGDDAIGRLGHGLATMFDNLRTLINNVQRAGIQVTTSATEIAASAKQQEATGVEQAQTSVEVLSTTKEISSNTQQLLKTMEDATAVGATTRQARPR